MKSPHLPYGRVKAIFKLYWHTQRIYYKNILVMIEYRTPCLNEMLVINYIYMINYFSFHIQMFKTLFFDVNLSTQTFLELLITQMARVVSIHTCHPFINFSNIESCLNKQADVSCFLQ